MKKETRCWICRINPGVTKNYVAMQENTDNEIIHKFWSCRPCITLNGKSVQTLVAAKPDRVRRLIKKWWEPDKRSTTLPRAYPSVDWGKVRI